MPRLRRGSPVKYETPNDQRNGIDFPPGEGEIAGDPGQELCITEGTIKASSASTHSIPTIALPGVWSWLGTNDTGGKTVLEDWRDVALNERVVLAFDSDFVEKPAVRKALDALSRYLDGKGAIVRYSLLPNGEEKGGLDDYLVDGHTADERSGLWSWTTSTTSRRRASRPTVTC